MLGTTEWISEQEAEAQQREFWKGLFVFLYTEKANKKHCNSFVNLCGQKCEQLQRETHYTLPILDAGLCYAVISKALFYQVS